MAHEIRVDGEAVGPKGATEVGALVLSESEAGLAKRRSRYEAVRKRVKFTPASLTELGIIELEGESPDNPNYSPMALWNAMDKKAAFGSGKAYGPAEQAYSYYQEADLALDWLYSANSQRPQVIIGDAKVIRANASAITEMAKLELRRDYFAGKSGAYRDGSGPYKKEIDRRISQIKTRADYQVVSAWAAAHHDALRRKRYWKRQLESVETHPEYEKGIEAARIPLDDAEQAA